MKKISVGIFGSTGRMGLELQKILSQDKSCDVVFLGSSQSTLEKTKLKKIDLLIDFSLPEAVVKNIEQAIRLKSAYVCGVTGMSEKQMASLKSAAQKIPVLWSSNMSMGVAVLNEALKVFSALKGFDFQIEEIHHKHKKDRPSGTAVTLQKNLEKAIGKKAPEPLSIRGGGVFGVHKIFAISDEETITFEHTALNRAVFAKGAVTAGLWLLKKKKGYYTISDCLFGK